MGGFIDKITGADKAQKAARRAAEMQRLQPFQVSGPFGFANITETGAEIGGGVGSDLGPLFAQFAAQALGQAGGASPVSFGVTADEAFQGAGATDPTGASFSEAGRQALAALQGFNADDFATTQFERLNRLAAPGEETQASRTANELFSRGRLGGGDSVSGEVFRDLDLSQRLARDNRLLQALGLAGEERDRLASQATGLAGQGSALQSDSVNRFLARLNAGTGVGSFQDQIINSALQRALAGTGGINTSIQPQLAALQAALTGAGLSTNARVGAASSILAGGNAAAQARGNLTGNIIGGASRVFSGGVGG